MQPDAKAKRPVTLGVKGRHPLDCLACRLHGPAGGLRPLRAVAVRDREDRERGVADEAQHLALVLEHRSEDAFEELVEQAQKVGPAHRVGERRGVAQVAEPDDGVDVLAVAAVNPAGEHLLAGLAAEVGLEDVLGRAPPGIDLGDAREGRHDAPQRLDLGLGEAFRAPGGKARGVDFAAEKPHRQRNEVRAALVAQLLEDRKIEPAAVANAPPYLDVLSEDDLQRAPQVLLGVLDADRRRHDFHRVARLVPDEAAARDVRVERAHEDRDAEQRNSDVEQPVAELLQQVLRPLRGRGALVEPLDDGFNVQSLRSHRLDSIAPSLNGRRASTPFTLRTCRLANSMA